jgi:hypothetical protein
MIEAMTRCAYELGMAASEIAKRSTGDARGFMAASAEFRHCFFAVRMGSRLAQTQRAQAAKAASPVETPERAERERPEAADRSERDDSLRLEVEHEREGDYEPVSLPQFLKSLRGAAASAERRDDLPAHIRETTLPTLRRLLGETSAPPDQDPEPRGGAPGVAVLARPPAAPASRSRLLTSTFTPQVRPTPRPRNSS